MIGSLSSGYKLLSLSHSMCDYCCAKRGSKSKPNRSKETAWRQYHIPHRPWKHFEDDATPIKWLNRMNAGCILFLIFIPFSRRGHHFIGKLWEEGNIQFYWENLVEVGRENLVEFLFFCPKPAGCCLEFLFMISALPGGQVFYLDLDYYIGVASTWLCPTRQATATKVKF